MPKVDMEKLPKKWNPFMIITGIFCLLVLIGYFFISQKTETKSVAQMQPTRSLESGVGGVGGEGSPEYNSMLTEDNFERAEQAASTGKSFIAVPVGKDTKTSLLEMEKNSEPKTPQAPAVHSSVQSSTPRQHTVEKGDVELLSYMGSLLGTMRSSGEAESYSFKLPKRAMDKQREEKAQQAIKGAELLIPGAILYAANDLTITSVAPGTPVRATVIHGPLKGAIAVGSFTQSGERLVLTFRSLTKDGITAPINGYGVDPVKAEAAVASRVDNNTFFKVAAFLASSFLEGWGVALQNTGTTRVLNNYEQITIRDKLKTSEQAQIAAGKMGERAANYLEKKIDEPPVVTLDAGTSLGILIVN